MVVLVLFVFAAARSQSHGPDGKMEKRRFHLARDRLSEIGMPSVPPRHVKWKVEYRPRREV
jgi:hypothetical protein